MPSPSPPHVVSIWNSGFICVGRLPKSPERFELIDMGSTSATFSWLSVIHTDSHQAYRLHYKSLSPDDNYSPIEVRISVVLTRYQHFLHVSCIKPFINSACFASGSEL